MDWLSKEYVEMHDIGTLKKKIFAGIVHSDWQQHEWEKVHDEMGVLVPTLFHWSH